MSAIKAGYTRISDILATLKDRTHINQMVLMDKAEIGTEVHSNIHMEEIGCPTTFSIFPVRNPITGYILREEQRGKGYFESYLKWREDNKLPYKLMEERFYDDELMITGQVDAICDNALIDFKCSYTPDLEIWPMQAHFYWYLLKQNGIQVDRFLFIQLKKDGKNPAIHEFAFDENILSRCIEEAISYNEAKNLALCVD